MTMKPIPSSAPRAASGSGGSGSSSGSGSSGLSGGASGLSTSAHLPVHAPLQLILEQAVIVNCHVFIVDLS
jgi:hypothetical protein